MLVDRNSSVDRLVLPAPTTPALTYQQRSGSSASLMRNSVDVEKGEGEGYVMGPVGGMDSFLDKVSYIRHRIDQLSQALGPLAAAHQRLLAAPAGEQKATAKAQVDQQEANANSLTRGVRAALSDLNDDNRHRPQSAEEYLRRRQHLEALQNLFKKALGSRLEVERECRRQGRLVAERQYKVVKQDATRDEIDQALASRGEQVFAQAVMSSRSTGARAALTEAHARQEELRNLEESISELAQIMQDLATMVFEQEDQFVAVEANAVEAEEQMLQGTRQVTKAKYWAAAARKKRWWCFGVSVVLMAVVVIIVVVEVQKN